MADTFMNTVVDEKMKRELEKLARDNERTLSGQVRFMLDQWMEEHHA